MLQATFVTLNYLVTLELHQGRRKVQASGTAPLETHTPADVQNCACAYGGGEATYARGSAKL